MRPGKRPSFIEALKSTSHGLACAKPPTAPVRPLGCHRDDAALTNPQHRHGRRPQQGQESDLDVEGHYLLHQAHQIVHRQLVRLRIRSQETPWTKIWGAGA